MTLHSGILERIRKQAPSRSFGLGNFGMTGAYGERYEPESRRDFVEAYRDRVYVQRCVNYVANAAQSVPIKAYRGRRADPTEVEDHPVLDLFDRPSPRDPAMTFFGMSVFWSQILGEWHWELIAGRGGGIAEAYPLRSYVVRVKPDAAKAGRIAGFTYDPDENGMVREFPAADANVPRPRVESNSVLYGRFTNPLDDYYGLAPLRGAKDDVIADYYYSRYNHRFFRNSARPDIILGFDQLDTQERAANKQEWQEFKGVDQAHRAAILSGKPNVTELGKTPQDVAYGEGRQWSREAVCAAFGVPPVLVGDLTHATYSNYEQAQETFWHDTMVPLLSYFASWATWAILPYYPGVDWIEFDTSGIEALQENEGARIERLAAAVTGGLMTPDEAREELGLEEVDEGGDMLYLPSTLTPIADENRGTPALTPAEMVALMQGKPPGGPDQEPPDGAPQDGQTVDGTATEEPQAALPPGKHIGRSALYKARGGAARYMQLRTQAIRQATHTGGKLLSKVFASQEKAVLSAINGRSGAQIAEALEQRDWSADAKRLEDAAGEIHKLAAVGAATTTDQVLSPKKANERVIEGAGLSPTVAHLANRPKGIVSVAGRIKEDVLQEVRIGISYGLTHHAIANGGEHTVTENGQKVDKTFQGIRGVYGQFKGWQAERIARTETAYAFNTAAAATFRDAGLQEVDIVDGDDFDEACAEANGQRWTLDEYDANPLEHPNCTRMGLPVVE